MVSVALAKGRVAVGLRDGTVQMNEELLPKTGARTTAADYSNNEHNNSQVDSELQLSTATRSTSLPRRTVALSARIACPVHHRPPGPALRLFYTAFSSDASLLVIISLCLPSESAVVGYGSGTSYVVSVWDTATLRCQRHVDLCQVTRWRHLSELISPAREGVPQHLGPQGLGLPTAVAVGSGCVAIGTNSGEVYLCEWDPHESQDAPHQLQSSSGGITNFVLLVNGRSFSLCILFVSLLAMQGSSCNVSLLMLRVLLSGLFQ